MPFSDMTRYRPSGALSLALQRSGVLASLGLAHLALILVLLVTPRAVVAVPPPVVFVTDIAEPQRVVPAVVPAVSEIPVPTDLAMPLFETSADAALPAAVGDSVADCRIAEDITAALQSDATVGAALAMVPPSARSVGNAVMLWEGSWADAAQFGGARVIDPIRRTIVTAIRAAPPVCAASMLTGPRIIVVSNGAATLVLAFGSGSWSWTQLAV